MGTLRNGNLIGRNITKFRHRKNWTQEILVAKMQLHGCCMTRDVIANIETCRCAATEKQIMYFAAVFGVETGALYTQNCPDANGTDR
jgi:transcriptional regulator with XRE-family HTH domain